MIKLKSKSFKVPTNHGRHTVHVLEPNVNYIKIQKWIDESVNRIFDQDSLVNEIKNKVKVRVWED